MPEKKQTILAMDDTEINIDTLLEIPVAEEEQTIAAVDDVENNIDSLLEILIPDKKQTILVVDDTEIDIDVLLEILSNDYIVRVAADGESALDSVKDSLPDLILLDVLMPGLHGFEVCYRLKANRSTQSIPVIFITSLAEVQDETHGLELGAVDYITKPFNPAIVRARIKNHLELKRHRDVMALLMARKSRELTEAYSRLKIIKEIEFEFHTAFSHKLDALTKSLLGISDLALWNMQEEWRSNEDSPCLNLPAESIDE
jgi:PleD family two-component response regulator